MIDPALVNPNDQNSQNILQPQSVGTFGKSESYFPGSSNSTKNESVTSILAESTPEILPTKETPNTSENLTNVAPSEVVLDNPQSTVPNVVDLRHKPNSDSKNLIHHKVGPNADSITTLADIAEEEFIDGVFGAHDQDS